MGEAATTVQIRMLVQGEEGLTLSPPFNPFYGWFTEGMSIYLESAIDSRLSMYEKGEDTPPMLLGRLEQLVCM